MKDSKKAPTGAATSAGATAEAGTERPTTSTKNDTTSGAGRQMVHIADFLSHGAENGITIRHLEKMTDLDSRTIRRMIERERRGKLALIVSNNRDGYFLTDDPAEAEQFAKNMEHRAREILKTARAIREAAGLD